VDSTGTLDKTLLFVLLLFCGRKAVINCITSNVICNLGSEEGNRKMGELEFTRPKDWFISSIMLAIYSPAPLRRKNFLCGEPYRASGLKGVI
jgi:hypothetical protein